MKYFSGPQANQIVKKRFESWIILSWQFAIFSFVKVAVYKTFTFIEMDDAGHRR